MKIIYTFIIAISICTIASAQAPAGLDLYF